MGGPMRTLSMTTGWFVRTSSYSVDIQRWAKAKEWNGMGCVGDLVVGLTVQFRLASSDASVVFLKSANHDRQTSFDISQLYPPPLLNLPGAVPFVLSKHCP